MRRLGECWKTCAIAVAATALLATGGAVQANVLANPGFETPDASAGDVGATAANSSWNGFNGAFITASTARTGTQSFKAFGNPGGAFQDFAASPGETWTGSVYAQNFANDPLIGSQGAFVNIEWRDSGGGVISFESTEIVNSLSPQNVWTLGTVMGVAPAGTTTARFVLLSGPFTAVPGGGGGAAFFDDATFVVPEPASAIAGLALLGLATRRRR